MPELPEVEVTRRSISTLALGRTIEGAVIRCPALRWPVPEELPRHLAGVRIETIERRAKYLLIGTATGTLIVHLGMSGRLTIVGADDPPQKHDHLDIVLNRREALRLHDPRRFGAVLWTTGDPARHWLLRALGPEPLGGDFGGRHLYERSRGRRGPIKCFVMDGRVVAGVGNIYANEALHSAGIHPARAAGRLSLARHERLAAAIRDVLTDAIREGGTTLRDFVDSNGDPGAFRPHLRAYGRADQPCDRCGTAIRVRTIGQRASFYCPRCQH